MEPPEVFYKKVIFKNFATFTGKYLCWSLFFNKVTGLTYFEEHERTAASAPGISSPCFFSFKTLVSLAFYWERSFYKQRPVKNFTNSKILDLKLFYYFLTISTSQIKILNFIIFMRTKSFPYGFCLLIQCKV